MYKVLLCRGRAIADSDGAWGKMMTWHVTIHLGPLPCSLCHVPSVQNPQILQVGQSAFQLFPLLDCLFLQLALKAGASPHHMDALPL